VSLLARRGQSATPLRRLGRAAAAHNAAAPAKTAKNLRKIKLLKNFEPMVLTNFDKDIRPRAFYETQEINERAAMAVTAKK